MISASSLERIVACPKSARLPQVDSPSDDSERGTNVHRYLANVMSGTNNLAGVDPKYHDLCAAMDLSSLPAVGTFAAEVAFAFNVRTGTARLLDAKDRAYAIDADEIPGTADAVGLTADAVCVIDWKGRWSKATSAADNLQLRFYALCAARVYGKDSATVAIARVGEDGIRWDVAELSVMDLDLFAMELPKIAEDARTSERMTEGEHCRYCPAFDACPAKQTLLRMTAETIEAQTEVAIDTMDDGARAEVWARLKALETVVERAKERMRESIVHRPIRNGDRVIAVVEEERRSIDVEKALELAPELAACVKRSLTITDAEKALGKKNIGRIADAVRKSRITKIKEMSAEKILAANS